MKSNLTCNQQQNSSTQMFHGDINVQSCTSILNDNFFAKQFHRNLQWTPVTSEFNNSIYYYSLIQNNFNLFYSSQGLKL